MSDKSNTKVGYQKVRRFYKGTQQHNDEYITIRTFEGPTEQVTAGMELTLPMSEKYSSVKLRFEVTLNCYEEEFAACARDAWDRVAKALIEQKEMLNEEELLKRIGE